jgi:hypothetical protein
MKTWRQSDVCVYLMKTCRGSRVDYCSREKSVTTVQKCVYAVGGLEFYGCKS